MTAPPPDHTKPPVLKQPRRLRRFLMLLIAFGVVIYIGMAATGFLNNQTKPEPELRSAGSERVIDDQAN